MARRARPTDGKGEQTGTLALRGNGYEPGVTQGFVDRIEAKQTEIEEIMQKARDQCAPLREDITDIKREAHEAGLPRREFNAALQKRGLLRKADEVRETLSEEQRDQFDLIMAALGGSGDAEIDALNTSRRSGDGDRAH